VILGLGFGGHFALPFRPNRSIDGTGGWDEKLAMLNHGDIRRSVGEPDTCGRELAGLCSAQRQLASGTVGWEECK